MRARQKKWNLSFQKFKTTAFIRENQHKQKITFHQLLAQAKLNAKTEAKG